MYYQFYEWNHAFLSPARAMNDAVRLLYKNPLNPLSHTEFGRQIVAAGDVFERLTRRYGKPEFGLDTTDVDGIAAPVEERIVWERPFCRLVHFHRHRPPGAPKQPTLVIVAPMSGHYSTLLRGTVAALLPHHEVYITDWIDARMVPLALGRFDLDDYIDYVISIVEHLGDAHLVAVCQPAVPVFAATALLEAREAAVLPRSITLMGGPIDTSESPTEVNLYAAKHDLDWFRRNVIMTVPYPYPGVMRRVYPGFLQLSGFMTMNLDRHLHAHYDYFDDLVKGDGDGADKHREFYDEYLSVMDLTAEFYIQTVDTVFLRQALPKGTMRHRDRPVDPRAITRTPILTVEGEKDDISGVGQTQAAHRLTPNLPAEKHGHYEQKDVGHYGVFNGSRFRREIAPRITEFVSRWDAEAAGGRRASHPPGPSVAAGTTGPSARVAGAVAATETPASEPPAPFDDVVAEDSRLAVALRSPPRGGTWRDAVGSPGDRPVADPAAAARVPALAAVNGRAPAKADPTSTGTESVTAGNTWPLASFGIGPVKALASLGERPVSPLATSGGASATPPDDDAIDDAAIGEASFTAVTASPIDGFAADDARHRADRAPSEAARGRGNAGLERADGATHGSLAGAWGTGSGAAEADEAAAEIIHRAQAAVEHVTEPAPDDGEHEGAPAR